VRKLEAIVRNAMHLPAQVHQGRQQGLSLSAEEASGLLDLDRLQIVDDGRMRALTAFSL